MDLLTTDVSSESGQSLLEFTLLLPVLLGFTMILIRVNTAIQVSIVNQQYSRGHALFLTFNSPNYPETKFQNGLAEQEMNQMVHGVSQNVAPDVAETYSPQATIQNVTRSLTVRGKNAPQEEPDDKRSRVRVRNTVTLCTPTYYLMQTKSFVRSLDVINNVVTRHGLSNNTRFDFCGSTIEYYE